MNKTLFRILRGFCGLNQTELGTVLGREQSTIAKYEIGSLQIPAKVAERMEELVKEQGISDFDIMLLQQLIKSSAEATKAGVKND